MEIILPTIGFDGKDEIIFSKSFNIYENELKIPALLGFDFVFVFENNEPDKNQQDVTSKPGENNEIIITLSKKFRNSLGSMTANKIAALTNDKNQQILFSIFGQQTGGSNLHVTINFYIRSL